MYIAIKLFVLFFLLIRLRGLPIWIIKSISSYLRPSLVMSQADTTDREPVQLNPHIFENSHDQTQSLFFCCIPPEIRAEIFAYALSEFEDTTKSYSADTPYTRPGYSAPRRAYIDILLACKKAYTEAWWIPFTEAEHTFYLAHDERVPEQHKEVKEKTFRRSLNVIHDVHGDFRFKHARLFAQMYILEPGSEMQAIFDVKYFEPINVTLTLRYADFWYWEDNRNYWINATWVNKCRFPAATECFRIDFESIDRRKNEIEALAQLASEKWFFRRKDGRILRARPEEKSVFRWTGSSTWGGVRWLRDESRQNQIDYYGVTITWRVSEDTVDPSSTCETIEVIQDNVSRPFVYPPSIAVERLQQLQLPADASADDIREALSRARVGVGHTPFLRRPGLRGGHRLGQRR